MSGTAATPKRGILERLDAGEVVIGDGGFLFALEKRGYVKFGQYSPDCTVEHPDAVRQLHREFLRAGADVMQAFTFNGTQESIESRNVNISAETLNSAACDIAQEVANEGDALCAGGVCYTISYKKNLGKEAVQNEYRKQAEILLKKNVDFLIAEYIFNVEEAVWATEVLKATGKPTAVTVSMNTEGDPDGVEPGQAAVRLAQAGADIIGVNCRFDPNTCLETLQLMKEGLERAGLKRHLVVQPPAYHTPDVNCHTGFVGLPEYPYALEPRVLTRWEVMQYARKAYNMGARYIGACCGFEPYHVRAMAEELAPERGKLPAASEKHSAWGEAFKDSQLLIERKRVGKDYWGNLKPATGRPESAALSRPLTDE